MIGRSGRNLGGHFRSLRAVCANFLGPSFMPVRMFHVGHMRLGGGAVGQTNFDNYEAMRLGHCFRTGMKPRVTASARALSRSDDARAERPRLFSVSSNPRGRFVPRPPRSSRLSIAAPFARPLRGQGEAPRQGESHCR